MSIKDENNNGTIWSDSSRTNADSEKHETVGSLSFKVIDASSKKPSTEKAKSNVGSSENTKSGAKKPISRSKVPFQIGYSHMDWLKVTRTHPDLAGVHIFLLIFSYVCNYTFYTYNIIYSRDIVSHKIIMKSQYCFNKVTHTFF